MPEICIIVAAGSNLAIGKNNEMPWHLPADLKYFKRTTSGFPVIMGRKTYDSIGKALPKRRNIVISRQDINLPDAEIYHSLEGALHACATEEKLFIIGGAQIFSQSMHLADRIFLTEIQSAFAADTYFPEINKDEWEEISREAFPADEQNQYDLAFVVLQKRPK